MAGVAASFRLGLEVVRDLKTCCWTRVSALDGARRHRTANGVNTILWVRCYRALQCDSHRFPFVPDQECFASGQNWLTTVLGRSATHRANLGYVPP